MEVWFAICGVTRPRRGCYFSQKRSPRHQTRHQVLCVCCVWLHTMILNVSFGKKTQKRDMWYEPGVNGGNLQWGRPGEKRVADKKKQLAMVGITVRLGTQPKKLFVLACAHQNSSTGGVC